MNMKIKNLRAESFQQGEQILKSQLHSNYKIVGVESKRKWFVGPKCCDISYVDLSVKDNAISSPQPLNPNVYAGTNATISPELQHSAKQVEKLSKEMENMKDDFSSMFETLMKDVGVALQKAERNSNEALNEVEDVLVKNGVAKDIAQDIIKEAIKLMPRQNKVTSKTTILFALKEVLEKKINVCDGYDLKKVKSIMLVGPTGVGKTTTLAKLASILYAEKRDVGLITLDTYRLGAVTQLAEYGRILDFPIEACSDIDELQTSLLNFMDKNCVLVDTTGQNQKNIIVDEELKRMVDLVNPEKLSLVLSATTKTEDLYDCINKFSVLDINSIIITKIDETNTLGEVINIAYKYPKIKLAYFTTGQDVPADIEGARSEKIIKSVIKMEG